MGTHLAPQGNDIASMAAICHAAVDFLCLVVPAKGAVPQNIGITIKTLCDLSKCLMMKKRLQIRHFRASSKYFTICQWMSPLHDFCAIQVLFAFMVGMTNLYRYYGTLIIENDEPASESFRGSVPILLCSIMERRLLKTMGCTALE